MIGLLGKIHFYRKAGAASVFDWLADIYRDDPVMAGRAHAYRNFCIDRRGYQERSIRCKLVKAAISASTPLSVRSTAL